MTHLNAPHAKIFQIITECRLIHILSAMQGFSRRLQSHMSSASSRLNFIFLLLYARVFSKGRIAEYFSLSHREWRRLVVRLISNTTTTGWGRAYTLGLSKRGVLVHSSGIVVTCQVLVQIWTRVIRTAFCRIGMCNCLLAQEVGEELRWYYFNISLQQLSENKCAITPDAKF